MTAVLHAKDNIRCNSVHPGTTRTAMLASVPGGFEKALEWSALGRIADPENIAYGVLYLASDESSFLTGSELVIDGGYTAQ